MIDSVILKRIYTVSWFNYFLLPMITIIILWLLLSGRTPFPPPPSQRRHELHARGPTAGTGSHVGKRTGPESHTSQVQMPNGGRPPFQLGRPPFRLGRPPFQLGRPPFQLGIPPFQLGRPPSSWGKSQETTLPVGETTLPVGGDHPAS